jgi:Protein of unknown function (DUF2628)
MSEWWEALLGWLFIGTGIFVGCVLIVIWLVTKQRNRSDSIPTEEAAGATAIDEDLFRRFIGPNQNYYINIWKRGLSENQRGRFVMARSWNWPAALCFFPWALYRKMWLWAFAVPVATVVVTVAIPSINSLSAHLVQMGLTGWWANALYLSRTTRKFEKLISASVSEAQLLTQLDKAGGVSKVAAWFGGISFTLIELLSLYVVLRAHSDKFGF